MSADLISGPAIVAVDATPRETRRLAPPSFVTATWLIARKDMIVELRTRTALLAALALSLLSIVIFNFAWDPTAVAAIDLAPGLLWVTFSGLLGLHRAFGVEQADRAMDALLGAPIPRTAIYAGKALGNLALVLLVQLVSIPAALVVYNLEVARVILPLGGIALLAGIGLVAVGTLFGAMTTSTRASELLLPVLALPFVVPVVTAAAQATARLMGGRPVNETIGWLKLLAAYDIIFVVACAFAYTVIADE